MKHVELEILKYYFDEFWKVINHEDYDWSYDYTLSNLHPESKKNQELEEIFNIEYLKILNESREFNQAKKLLKKFMVEARNTKLKLMKIDLLRINLAVSPFVPYDDDYSLYSFRLNDKHLNDKNKLFSSLLEIFNIINDDNVNIFTLWLQQDDLKYNVIVDEKDDLYHRTVFKSTKSNEKITSTYIIRKKSLRF